MKEYKVALLMLGMRKREKKFEDILNSHARQGWELHMVVGGFIIFTRAKYQ